jgi:alpha-tubulin suppressor-like RCC1 family protein
VGSEPDVLPPSHVGSLRHANCHMVACGTAHTLALTVDGRVYAWGYNGQGAVNPAIAADAVLQPNQVLVYKPRDLLPVRRESQCNS